MEQNLKHYIYDNYFIKCNRAQAVCEQLQIKRDVFTSLCFEIDAERKSEILEMRRIRQLYNNKRGENFHFDDFYTFYYWFIGQYKKQDGCCYYCKTEEAINAELFEKKYTSTKRLNRGKHFEVERRDSHSNIYNPENCVLACYFCNNDKSDIFSEEEYLEYLKDRKKFFNKQFNALK